MIYEWQGLLEESSIRYLTDLSLVEYLSKPSDRFQWTSHALPSDDLSIENAIILQRYIRYPLIIDPSGQVSIERCERLYFFQYLRINMTTK